MGSISGVSKKQKKDTPFVVIKKEESKEKKLRRCKDLEKLNRERKKIRTGDRERRQGKNIGQRDKKVKLDHNLQVPTSS